MPVVYFPLLSLSIACLMLAVSQIKSTGIAVLDAFVLHTSKVSYSLYLGHIAMLTTMLGLMDLHGWRADDLSSTVLMYLGLAIFYYGFANLTYVFVERPYIRLRDVKLGSADVRSGNVAMAVESSHEEPRRASSRLGQPG